MPISEGLNYAETDFRAPHTTTEVGFIEITDGMDHEDTGTGPFYIDVYKKRDGQRTLEIYRHGTEAVYLPAYDYQVRQIITNEDGSIEEYGSFFVPPTCHGTPNTNGWRENEHEIKTLRVSNSGLEPVFEIIPPQTESVPQEEVSLYESEESNIVNFPQENGYSQAVAAGY